ncbi:MAG: methyltransferase domain-containing protein [Bacteroidales bacterium]|jgi:ubiquinone/menaquinone biosynthesis C-methylase UbiE|nr:methyltransferase domain-containing protein [Bacteroidales bacterium]
MVNKIFDSNKRHVLDNEDRRKTLPPESVISFLNIGEDDDFLDIGAGTGYFFLPAIENSGKNRKNIALDISETMLDELREKLKNNKTKTELYHGDAISIPQPDNSINKILMAFVFHEFDNPRTYLNEIKRVLKPNGEIGILEWEAKETNGGPPMHERLSEEKLQSILSKNGWKLVRNKSINQANYMHIYRIAK